MPRPAKLRARPYVGDTCDPPCGPHAPSVCICEGSDSRYAHGQRSGGGWLPGGRPDSRSVQTARATRATRVRLHRRALNESPALALGSDSDKVPDSGGAMATKQPPTKKTRPAKKASKKRPRKASAKPATKKRRSKAPAKSSQPTTPAKPSTKRAAGKSPSASTPVSTPAPVSTPVPAPASVPVPPPAPTSKGPAPHQATSSRPPSYLESVPQDHAELVSGLFRVVRGAAKDLKTLVTQAIAMSNQKNDRPRR